MRPLFFLFSLFISVLFSSVSAQVVGTSGIPNMQKTQLGYFSSEGNIAGYYCVWDGGSTGKGQRTYHLKTVDQDLVQIASIAIPMKKRIKLINTSTSGNTILLLFYDYKEKAFSFRQFSTDGEQKHIHTFTAYNSSAAAQILSGHELSGIPDSGFLHFGIASNQLSIRFFPKDTSQLSEWKVTRALGSNAFLLEYLTHYQNQVYFILTDYKGILSRDGIATLLTIDISEGQIRHEQVLEDEQYGIRITNGMGREDQLFMFGQYYEKRDQVFMDKSLGICLLGADLDGKVRTTKYFSWDSDISPLFRNDEMKKLKRQEYLFLHESLSLDNGNHYIIGESYQPTVGTLNVVSTITTGDPGPPTIAIEDLYLFEFAPDLSIKSVAVIEKNKSKISLSSQANHDNMQIRAKTLQEKSYFDYLYTQRAEDGLAFTSIYTNNNRMNPGTLGTFAYLPDPSGAYILQQTIKEIPNFKGGTLPGKPGHILIYEYYADHQLLTFRLEGCGEVAE